MELVGQHRIPVQLFRQRPLLKVLESEDVSLLTNLLTEEEHQIRDVDRHYWTPLKKELEMLRHARISRDS